MTPSENRRSLALQYAVDVWQRRLPNQGGLTQAITKTAAAFDAFLSGGDSTVGSESDIDTRFDHLEELMAASQADIDALTSAVGNLSTELTADTSAIQTEIANLQAQGVDVSGLQSAVTDLSSKVDAVGALVPPATASTPSA